MEVRGEKIKRRGITELLNPVRLGLAACLHGWLKTKPEIFLDQLYEMKVKVWTHMDTYMILINRAAR